MAEHGDTDRDCSEDIVLFESKEGDRGVSKEKFSNILTIASPERPGIVDQEKRGTMPWQSLQRA